MPLNQPDGPEPLRKWPDAYARFGACLRSAEERLAADDLVGAASLTRLAAQQTFPEHPGLFASPRLERLLLRLAERIQTASSGADPRPEPGPQQDASRRRVLHVLSYARPLGGDSRFAWRWIQNDKRSRHSVAVVAQNEASFDVPQVLSDAVAASGGSLRLIEAPSSKPLEQAAELRRLCRGADVVVLHSWPDDIVPVLALGAGCEPVRVVFMNHSDHTFWMGGSVANLIAHHREQPRDLIVERRGLDPDLACIVPIPLPPSRSPIDGEEAKAELNVGANTLLLTIASAFKYATPGETTLLDLVVPALVDRDDALLYGVGMDPEGPWREAQDHSDGRIRALGVRWDNDLLYAAADVYLDSAPFASITSALEAGSLGCPVIAFARANPELSLLSLGAPGLDGAVRMTDDPTTYRRMLDELISDETLRRELGDAVRRQVHAAHQGTGWTATVDELYRRLDASDGATCLVGEEDVHRDDDIDRAIRGLYSHVEASLRPQLHDALRHMPYRQRMAILRTLRRQGLRIPAFNVVPPPFDTFALGAIRWTRRALRRARDAVRR